MPTIRRIFLILLTITAVFVGSVYALAYMVKPKTAEMTITIPNGKLNLRPWPIKPNTPMVEPQSPDNDADGLDESLR